MSAYAQSTVIDGMSFFVRNDGTASLVSVNTGLTALTVPGTVVIDAKSYPVTHVARGAFNIQKTITSITFSEGIQEIDELAINNCSMLKTINLPASLKSWNHSLYKCTLMESYNVASGSANYSSENGFLYNADKTKLIAAPRRQVKITFPATVTEIGDYAFEYTFASNIPIPETITSIGKYAFAESSQFTSMTLPASLTSLGEGAFYSCLGLNNINVAAGSLNFSSVDNVLYDFGQKTLLFVPMKRTAALTLPSTVTIIAAKAAYKSGISGVTFPEGLKTIGAESFAQCLSLNGTIDLPASLTEIGTNAFNMVKVSAYNVAVGNTTFSAQDGVLYNADKTTLLRYPMHSTAPLPLLPKTLTRIETNAFANSLVTGDLVIPAGVTQLGDGVFGNTQLNSIVLPEGITEIPANTFSFSSVNLKKIVLPSTVTSISTNVFLRCDFLTDIEYRGKELPTLGSTISSSVTLHVREDASHTASQWGSLVTMVKDLAVLPLNMSSYKYATFHWADKNYAMPVGLRGATLRLKGSDLETRYDFVAGDVVGADIALLMNGNEGNYDLVETKFAPKSNVDVTGNVLFGRAAEDRYEAKNGRVYVLTTKDDILGFYWQKDSDGTFANIKVHRGYMDVNTHPGTQGYRFDGNFLTALQSVESTPATPQSVIYDLSGRLVQSPTRGLYIVNGKKVVF